MFTVENIISLAKALEKNKGSFAKVEFQRPMRVSAKYKETTIQKRTECIARFGVQYDNIKSVQNKRENGELPKENQGLPFGQWVIYPYLIEHKGEYYLRMSLVNGNYPKSIYRMGDTTITKEQAKEYCIKSEFKENGEVPDVITVKLNNIINIK